MTTNIENYDEIIEWLEDNSIANGVQHSAGHGSTSDGYMNVGLFSVNELHPDACGFCRGGHSWPDAMTTKFDIKSIRIIGADLDVEDPDNTHLIVF